MDQNERALTKAKLIDAIRAKTLELIALGIPKASISLNPFPDRSVLSVGGEPKYEFYISADDFSIVVESIGEQLN